MKIELDVQLWLDGNKILVWVGDEDDPSMKVSLPELIKKEMLMYAIPATAKSLKEVDYIKDEDGNLEKLRDTLQRGANLLTKALEKE